MTTPSTSAAARAALVPRDVVAVNGPDAVSYLQGQLSADVDALAVGTSTWALALHPQGKVAAWFRLTRVDTDAFRCDVDAGHGDRVVERLARFRLRTRCDIEPVAGCVLCAIRGDHVPDLEVPSGVSVIPVEWAGWRGVDLLGPQDIVAALLPIDGVETADRIWYEAGRIGAGLPAMGAEIDDDTIPAEVGVVEASVCFTKGCFVGQELVARIDSRGAATPRRLRRLVVDGPAPPAGAAVVVGDAPAGRITSAAIGPEPGRAVALGLLKRDVEPPVDAVVRWDGGSAAARVLT